MVDVARARKLAVRIREVVASTLEMQVKDPRLGMVTITDAKLTPDLREATLYYTVYGSDEERQATAMALESAKGVLRAQVGKQTGVRHTPSLAFIADVVPENAGRIEELLAKARAEDAKVHEQAEGAQPAGDADPYRVPRVVEDVADDDDADEDDAES
jgi:ribosome-binding factor A